MSSVPMTDEMLAKLTALDALRSTSCKVTVTDPEQAQNLKALSVLADAVPDLVAEVRRLRDVQDALAIKYEHRMKEASDILLERARQAEELLQQLERAKEIRQDNLNTVESLARQRDGAAAMLDEIIPLATRAFENLADDLDERPMRHSLGQLVAGFRHALGLCGREGCTHHKPTAEIHRARMAVVETAKECRRTERLAFPYLFGVAALGGGREAHLAANERFVAALENLEKLEVAQ